MATEKQIAANRKNAQRSTGPRTPEGKARSAMNALKHGLTSRGGPFPGEDPNEFTDHQLQMSRDLDPNGPVEAFLAERICRLSWFLLRASRFTLTAMHELYERTAAESDTKKHPDIHLGRMIANDFSDARVLDRLSIYERRFETSLFKTMRQYNALKNRSRPSHKPHSSSFSHYPPIPYYPRTKNPTARNPFSTHQAAWDESHPSAPTSPFCHAEQLSFLSTDSVNPPESASGIFAKQTQSPNGACADKPFCDKHLPHGPALSLAADEPGLPAPTGSPQSLLSPSRPASFPIARTSSPGSSRPRRGYPALSCPPPAPAASVPR